MSLIVTQPPQLVGAKAKYSRGVFEAELKWQYSFQPGAISGLENLPDVAAIQHINSGALPVEGAIYPNLPLVSCREVDGWQDYENPGTFYHKAKFTDANTDGRRPATSTNPLHDLPVVTPIAGTQTIAIYQDVDGLALQNAAGDPMIDEAEYQTIGFSVEFNAAEIPSWYGAVVDSRNSDTLTLRGLAMPPGVARLTFPQNWMSKPQFRNGIRYYECKIDILADFRNKHEGVLLDAGFREKYYEEGHGYRLRRIVDGNDGSEPSEPVPLDQNSAPPGARLINPTPDEVFYVHSKRLRDAGYSSLRLTPTTVLGGLP